jgi:hypothetical protein
MKKCPVTIALVTALAGGACTSTSHDTDPDGGGGGGGGGGGAGKNRYACPLDKPQKSYGWSINAKTVLESPETWTADNVYIVSGPLHLKSTLTIEAGTVVCFDYGPPGADGRTEPPPGGMDIDVGGGLVVRGTEAKHVVFTDVAPKGYWAGSISASISIRRPRSSTSTSTTRASRRAARRSPARSTRPCRRSISSTSPSTRCSGSA